LIQAEPGTPKEMENNPLDTTREQKIRAYVKTAFDAPALPLEKFHDC
jgi:hypothetical protein